MNNKGGNVIKDPRLSGKITAHFIAADGATATRTLPYPPPQIYCLALFPSFHSAFAYAADVPPEAPTVLKREYYFDHVKFSKFGKQEVAVYKERI